MALLLRQVDRGLAGRVAAAHDDHVEAAADARFEVGRRVVHARAFEAFEVVDREPPVARARRDDHRAARDLAPVGEHDHVEAVLDAQAGDLARRVEPGAEPHAPGSRRAAARSSPEMPFGKPT